MTFNLENLTVGGRKLVVRALVGSHNYNLNTKNSDTDWKFFVAPTFEDLYKGTFFSTAEQGALMDYSVHDVRKLGELVWKANVNFLEVLFSTALQYTDGLYWLFANPEKWAQMNLPAFYNATYGTHLQKLKTMHKGTAKTQELVDKFGYDTKDALHALRCLFVLERFLKTHSMREAFYFDKNDPQREVLLDVKAGKFTEHDFMNMLNKWYVMHEHDEMQKKYMAFGTNEELKAELEENMYNFVKKEMDFAS